MVDNLLAQIERLQEENKQLRTRQFSLSDALALVALAEWALEQMPPLAIIGAADRTLWVSDQIKNAIDNHHASTV